MDAADESRSNWMRFVTPATRPTDQNLVACQLDLDIYFYTIKPVPPNTELVVGACRELEDRKHQVKKDLSQRDRPSEFDDRDFI